jgi:DNA relaxase NicK
VPDPQSNLVPRSRPDSIACHTCENLLQRVNQARMHALLATAWAELRKMQPAAKSQVDIAASQMEIAFAELEGHWREAHRTKC